MEIRVFVLPDGQLQIMVDGEGVTFEQAKAATEVVLTQLRAEGLTVEQTSEVESHRTGGIDHVHVMEQHKANTPHTPHTHRHQANH